MGHIGGHREQTLYQIFETTVLFLRDVFFLRKSHSLRVQVIIMIIIDDLYRDA